MQWNHLAGLSETGPRQSSGHRLKRKPQMLSRIGVEKPENVRCPNDHGGQLFESPEAPQRLIGFPLAERAVGLARKPRLRTPTLFPGREIQRRDTWFSCVHFQRFLNEPAQLHSKETLSPTEISISSRS